ncbi:peptidase inhibitor family I36 protein [Phycicoccus sp.]|uniref:peptidase inhibitor family I36 protein n=1 Tax=Phycicoccus sp. TaxID=1902410 RepID=UPI002B813D36|nr:peptidase inhibitor family I36 protein [Phycicoccus sp.]HMM93743.1 peptidase inhibitor family I36 protein [Phycicoccus sp.]
MTPRKKLLAALATAAAVAVPMLGTAAPAQAAARDGVCQSGEFCYYYNSDNAGSVSDFTTSVGDYGTTQPSCYDFKGPGNGKGQCIKNNAASVWNRTGKTVRVYFNSNYDGSRYYQDFAAGAKKNLNANLKNDNASHRIGLGSGGSCSIAGTGDPKTCAQAVTWAKNHVHSGYQDGYYNLCDHLVGLAYGWAHSGSTTAYVHWTQIPGSFKHPGDTNVPAGALAFFSGGSGHVMISIGGGEFISNDIHGNGSYTRTTISEIKSKWGKPYLGWAQPWFKVNH